MPTEYHFKRWGDNNEKFKVPKGLDKDDPWKPFSRQTIKKMEISWDGGNNFETVQEVNIDAFKKLLDDKFLEDAEKYKTCTIRSRIKNKNTYHVTVSFSSFV